MERKYQMCTRCVMDTTDPGIEFDGNGVCNHCKRYDQIVKKMILSDEKKEKKLKEIVKKIKEDGKNKKYDCIIGVSGGVDSTYIAYKVKELGLRPLAVHLDNGWNSELAVGNIEKFLDKLDIDLSTHVVNWEEFKDLQLAYFKASVVDIEVVTDHAIIAIMYHVANQQGVKYILTGINLVTEAILPRSWVYVKKDLRNLMAIHRMFGKVRLKTYPRMGLLLELYYRIFRRMRSVSLLNYLNYNKDDAKKILQKKLDWEDYGGKHHESIFTKFYQAYILPTKFNIDKRKAHLSNLICSGQITREEALEELKKPLYDEEELKKDKEYVIKKFGLTEKEFEDLMELPIKRHQEYGTSGWVYLLLRKLKNLF